MLSTCIIPSQGTKEIAEVLNIRLNQHSFIETDPYFPILTSREGIFACGCSHAPMDIPTSVAEGSAAAGKIAEIINGGG